MIQAPKESRRKTTSALNLIGLLAVLVVAPIISYIYLKKGFDYRVEMLSEIEPKELDAETTNYIAPYLIKDGQAKLLHLSRSSEPASIDLIAQIDERIIEKPAFDIISFSVSTQDEITEGNNLHIIPVSVAYNGPHDFVLLDTGHVVRAMYQFAPGVEKDIIRHLSAIIPKQKKKTIKLEREQDN